MPCDARASSSGQKNTPGDIVVRWGYALYFVGRGIVQRLVKQRYDIRIGQPVYLKSAYAIFALWALIVVDTIVMVAIALPLP